MQLTQEGLPGFERPLGSDVSHKSKHRHKEKKHKHHHREHSHSRKRQRSDQQQPVSVREPGTGKGSITLAADYNSDPESGELSEVTKLAQKQAEREQQSLLRAPDEHIPETVPLADRALPRASKRSRQDDALLEKYKRNRPSDAETPAVVAPLAAQTTMANGNKADTSHGDVMHLHTAVQPLEAVPQAKATKGAKESAIEPATGASDAARLHEHRSHRRHRQKDSRKERDPKSREHGNNGKQQTSSRQDPHAPKETDRAEQCIEPQQQAATPTETFSQAAVLSPPAEASAEATTSGNAANAPADLQGPPASSTGIPTAQVHAAATDLQEDGGPADAVPASKLPPEAHVQESSHSRRHQDEQPAHPREQRDGSRPRDSRPEPHQRSPRRSNADPTSRARLRDRSQDSHRHPRSDRPREDRSARDDWQRGHRGSMGINREPERRVDQRLDRRDDWSRHGPRRDRMGGRDRPEELRGRPNARSDWPPRRRESTQSRERRKQKEREDGERAEAAMKEMMESQIDEDQVIEERRKRRQALLANLAQAESVVAPTATAAAAEGGLAAARTPPPASPGPQQGSAPSPLWTASPKKPGISADGSHQLGTEDDEVAGRPHDDGADSPLVPSSEDGDAAAAELDIWQPASNARDISLPDAKAVEAEAEMRAGKDRQEAEAAQRYQQEHQKEGATAELDMFAEDVVATPPTASLAAGAAPVRGLTDNYDDPEGYYLFQVGEMMDGRYEVFASHGKGVFSTVLRARDRTKRLDDGNFQEVAIKMIRSNDTMFAAGQTEKRILNKLSGCDPTSKMHCIRLLRTFEYRSHLCLVFESLDINLRELTKKYGAGVGLNLDGVCVYAKQMLVALHHLKNCGVLHADIKPDNILVNKKRNIVKLCDFGSAMLSGDNELTPYLVSRFYRAPEVILGLKYDHPMDIWSVGCVIYELFTSKILFPGKSNNEMLRCFMDLKGPFPKKMVKRGAFHEKHFESDPNMSFSLEEEDPIDHRRTRRIISNPTKKRDFAALLSSAEGDKKRAGMLADLLERMMHLDPDKRIAPKEALRHPFIKGLQGKK